MLKLLHRKIVSNLILNSLIISSAYSLWYQLSSHHVIQQSITIPIIWYDVPPSLDIAADEAITITYSCKRAEAHRIKQRLNAIYLSGNTLQPGTHQLLITQDNFFVPETIKLVDCKPSLISFTVQEKKI